MNKSERRFRTAVYQARQLRLMKAHAWNPWHNVDVIPGHILGRLRRHSFCDCGVPNCVMCGNPRRIFNQDTIQEKSALEAFQYELTDLFD